jgi:hypothetical protein
MERLTTLRHSLSGEGLDLKPFEKRMNSGGTKKMNSTQRYIDPEKDARVYNSTDFDSTEAAILYQFWQDNPLPPSMEQWFVFVTSITPAQELLRFVYPITAPLGTMSGAIIANAERQHAQHKRPPKSGPVEVLRMTPDVVSELNREGRTESGQGRCDFCGSKTDSKKVYDARDFVMVTGSVSKGGWLACGACSVLVDAGDTDGLIQQQLKVEEISEADVDMEIMRRHLYMFFENRK